MTPAGSSEMQLRAVALVWTAACGPVVASPQDDVIGDADPDSSTRPALRCPDPQTCAFSTFDDVDWSEEGWLAASAGDATIGFSVEDARSPPRSLHLRSEGSSTGEIGSAYVVLKRGFTTTSRTIALEADWKHYPQTMTAFGNLEHWSVALGSSARVAMIHVFDDTMSEWRFGATHVDPQTGSFVTQVYPIPTPPTDRDRWLRFRLEVELGEHGRIALAYNGTEVARFDDVVTAIAAPGEQTLSASIGAGTLQGITPPVEMLFDNVLVEILD